MIVEYANYLASRGYDTNIATNIYSSLFEIRSRVERISKSSNKINTILKAIFKKRDEDIIIADIIMMTLFLSLRNKRRLVYFAQDYDESYYRNFVMKLLIRIVYLYCLRVLNVPVIAVSQKLGELLKIRFKANVIVVPNGINLEVFYQDLDEEYLRLKGNSKVILIFLRSDYRKGLDVAVDVLLKFKEEIERKEFAIWGVGENIKLPFDIKNFGFVSSDKLRKIISCSDVFLYPSRHEGLPLFILEAMACGCPVVTTEAVDFVEDNVNGFKCKVEDVEALTFCLKEVLSNSEIRDRFIKEGLLTVKKFDLKKSMNLFEDALLSIVSHI